MVTELATHRPAFIAAVCAPQLRSVRRAVVTAVGEPVVAAVVVSECAAVECTVV